MNRQLLVIIQSNTNIYQATEQATELGFSARTLYIKPSDTESYRSWLAASGKDEKDVEDAIKLAASETEQFESDQSSTTVVVNDELENSCDRLSDYIFGVPSDSEATNGINAVEGKGDTVMAVDTEVEVAVAEGIEVKVT
jgi:guanylate kinase